MIGTLPTRMGTTDRHDGHETALPQWWVLRAALAHHDAVTRTIGTMPGALSADDRVRLNAMREFASLAAREYVPALPIDYLPRVAPRCPRLPNVATSHPERARYAVTVNDSTGHSDGWQVWQGEHLDNSGQVVEHAVPGARTRRTQRGQHMAWCTAVTLIGRRSRKCEHSHTCYVSQDTGHEKHWSCPVHGNDFVTGAMLAAPLDDSRAERVRVTKWAPAKGMANVPGAPLVANGTVMIANTAGDTITNGKRGSYGFRSKGKRGQAVHPEPSEPMMSSGQWPTRTRAATPDSGKILHYGYSVLARADLFGNAAPAVIRTRLGLALPDMAWHRDAAYLLSVRTSRGTLVKRNVPARSMANLLARDARAAEVIGRQVKRFAPARSRAAQLAANTRKATGAQRAVNAKSAATRKANSAARVAALMAKVHPAL